MHHMLGVGGKTQSTTSQFLAHLHVVEGVS
nr:MAG TPA: Tumor protein p53-inducible protein 11 [Caudoviricetes sp.]DAH59909.1 MAG TPA: p53-inducible protein [Caudoviricetes sp.]DAH72402.1 MAG TPA: p53-inducible protein [Caudoviricetes sp.]